MRKKDLTILSAAIVLALLIAQFPVSKKPFFSDKDNIRDDGAAVSVPSLDLKDIPGDPFRNIRLDAKAAYVFDVKENKPIFSLNEEGQFPLASLTKLMVALVAQESIPENVLISIPKEAVLQEGDNGFIVDERWLVSDVIDAMLLSSSNDAAFALALSIQSGATSTTPDFVKLMNKKASELGLLKTKFQNPTGLDISETQAGAYGSAKDISELLLHIINKYPSLLSSTGYETLIINSREFKNTNKLINEIPRIVFGKTGFSNLAGGNLAVVVDLGFNHPAIIVVLGSTEQGRFNDVGLLYEALRNQ